MQFDLFDDSRDVALRNDVIEALRRGDAAAAGVAWRVLQREAPRDPALRGLALLAAALAAAPGPPLHEAAALAPIVDAFERRIVPSARALLDADADAFLAGLAAALAARAAGIAWSRTHPHAHAAPLWLHARDPQAAEAAVATIPSWRRIPVPLGWMAEARFGRLGLDASWPLFAELAWLAPQRSADLMRRIRHAELDRLRRAFDAGFDGDGGPDEFAWFPAWLLVERPALAPRLAEAQAGNHTPPEQAMRTLVELIGLEHQGRQSDRVPLRARLAALHAGLFAAYMRRR